MSDDTMRLRAELDDQTASKLKQMQKNYKETFQELRKNQREAAKEAREHTKHQKELHERLMKVKEGITDAVIPALGALGIATFGVGEGLAKFIDTMREAGESFNKINDAAKRAGTSAGYVTALGIAFENLGLSPDRARQSVGELGEHLDKLTRGAPDEINRMNGAFSNMGTSLNEALRGAHGREDQMERLFSFMSKQNFSMDQKRKWMATLGIPVELASKSAAEIKEAFEKGFDFERQHPTNMKVLKELDDAFTDLDVTITGIQVDLVNAFGTESADGIKQITGFVKDLSKVMSDDLRQELKDAEALFKILKTIWDGPNIPLLKKTPGEALHDMLHGTPNHNPRSGYKPTAFGLDDDRRGKSALSDAVKDGVLDAFREYISGKSGGSTGGFQNASFGDGFGGSGGGGARGAGINGGFHNGGGFRVLQNSGADIPGAPPEGSNAFKGVGGLDAGTSGGSQYLQARRKPIMDELKNNPRAMNEVRGMLLSEGTPKHTMESLFNRLDYERTMGGNTKSVLGMLHSGFYGPINRGQLASRIAQVNRDPALKAKLDKAITNAYGSNDLEGATDQGMKTDPNGRWRGGYKDFGGGNIFNDWGGGPGGHGGARRFRESLMNGVAEASAQHGVRAALRDHIRHKNLLGQRSSLDGKLTGDAHVRIDMNGAPRGTRTSATANGMFKSIKLNRGRAMPMADGDA
ncbi:hypothetical protein [Bradyrhizobium sp. LB11.1]|uniref:hypothetical protein n=1 Tax=Bradyrhizobium sp. LB11.1 TaxID=3156326 RepID=UPI0033986643